MLAEPCFNELSVFPLCTSDAEVIERIDAFVALLHRLGRYGFKKIRCEHGLSDLRLTEDQTLYEYCQTAYSKDNKDRKSRNNAEFLWTFIRKPYLKDDEESEFGNFDEVKYCVDKDKNTWCDCYGFYAAYLLNSFVVSFNMKVSNPCKLKLIKYKKEQDKFVIDSLKIVEIANVSNVEQLDNDDYVIDTLSEKDLKVPKASADEKQMEFTLPTHHGKKECMSHGKLLLQSPYVIKILNSIDFDSSERHYIHRVQSDGIIEVRLHRTKMGYGLMIATTARDIIETRWVAKKLDETYG